MAVTQLAKYLVVASLLCSIQILAQAKSINPADESAIIQDVETAVRTMDGGVEKALLNYLFAKQITERLNSNTDSHDLQQKRSYWKHCAFNAVTCFGK